LAGVSSGFLEGDPDRTADSPDAFTMRKQIVPYELPAHQTVSTFKITHSTGRREPITITKSVLRTRKGQEQIFINAEKDMDLRVENRFA